MSVSSIDLDAFGELVASLEHAEQELPAARAWCARDLNGVLLDTGCLRCVEQVLAFTAHTLPDLRRRLALALQIESSTPGLQAFVQLDDSQMPTDTPAEAAAQARRIASLIVSGGVDRVLDTAVLETLASGCADPYFASEVAARLSPRELAEFVLKAAARLRLLESLNDRSELASYTRRYGRMLHSLGSAAGLATRATGTLAMGAGYAKQWVTALTASTTHDVGGPESSAAATGRLGEASALSALLGQGRFSTDFTVELTRAVVAHEQQFGRVRIWSLRGGDGSGYVGAYDDRGRKAYDPLTGLMNAVAKDPVAASALFGSGPRTTISVAGAGYPVNSLIRYAIATRRWPDDGAAITSALQVALTPPHRGPDHTTAIRQDVETATAAFREDIEARTEDHGPISTLGHFLLDLGGMVPVGGELFDLGNAAWYGAEGDPVNAGGSFLGAIPLIGWGATGLKWGHRVLDAEDVARLGLKWRDMPTQAPLSLRLLTLGEHVRDTTFAFRSERGALRAMAHPHPGVTYRITHGGRPTDYVFDAKGGLSVVRGPGAASRTDIPVPPMEKIEQILTQSKKNGATLPDHRGNREYLNRPTKKGEARMPAVGTDGKPITYTEYYVSQNLTAAEKAMKKKTDGKRLLTTEDGTVWYTDDHYLTMVRIR